MSLRRPGAEVELAVSAYANGGFRAGRPELILPRPLAEQMGFDVGGAPIGEGVACGGVRIASRELGEIDVKVNIGDRETPWARAWAICIEGEEEALMSRELMAVLKLVPYYGRNTWRLEDDPPGLFRPEAEPQRWRREPP